MRAGVVWLYKQRINEMKSYTKEAILNRAAQAAIYGKNWQRELVDIKPLVSKEEYDAMYRYCEYLDCEYLEG